MLKVWGLLLVFCSISLQAFSQNNYIVTTNESPKSEDANAGSTNSGQPESAELAFLNEHFPYLSLCDWQPGMRFMVIPGERDAFIRTFTDSISGHEVATSSLQYLTMVYRGHETTPRGWIHLNFYCPDNQKSYYHQVRNFTFEEYCTKVQDGGVSALAYLDEIDRARDLLIGKELWLKLPDVYQDSNTSPTGHLERKVATDLHVRVEKIGVGSREYPVKIVFRSDDGQLFYQSCAMSCTNSGMMPNEFVTNKAHHYFANAFSFASGASTKAATMARKLVNKYITLRRPVKMKVDGTTRTIKAATKFIVERVTAHANSDYYTLMLTNNNRLHEIDVTFVNSNVVGNIDGNDEHYFDELFTIGETYVPSNSILRNDRSVSGTGLNFMNMLGGSITKGMSKEDVKLIKGEPTQTHRLNGGGTQWDYYDTKIQFNKAGRVSRIINQ